MKKTIFISSTFEDLKEHRGKVWELLEKYDVDVRGMEKFGARKEAPLATCLSEVEQSNIFVGIIGYRLGTLDEKLGKSFTQIEYEKAVELKQEVLIYIIDDNDSKANIKNIDFDENREKLLAFKATLKDKHTVDFFVSEDDLANKLKTRFATLLSKKGSDDKKEPDGFAETNELINKFILLPALYSGREVKLLVDFDGDPFPASKLLCSIFNLNYGKTIGIQVKVKLPEMEKVPFEHVFIDQYCINEFLSMPNKTDVVIYGKLQFSENRADTIKANFIRKEYYSTTAALQVTSAFSLAETFKLGERKVIEAEGQIILKISRFHK